MAKIAKSTARMDPYRNFNFYIELDGIVQGSFMECSGLETATEAIENREGGDNTTVRKLPGKTTYTDITLKWGLTDSDELWQWRNDVINGTITRRHGAIVIMDLTNRVPVARWDFINAWPIKYDAPTLNAKGNEVAIETLVLAHEGLTRS